FPLFNLIYPSIPTTIGPTSTRPSSSVSKPSKPEPEPPPSHLPASHPSSHLLVAASPSSPPTSGNCMRFFERVAALFHHDKAASPVPSSLAVNTKEEEKKIELVLERWTLACFGNDLIPARQNLSIVFAPLPTLTLYSLLYLTLAEKARKRMRKICAVSAKSITSLGPLVSSLLSSLDPPSSLFFRVFVDRSQLSSVHDSWTDTAQSIFGNNVVTSVDRNKLPEYIRNHSNEILAHTILPSGKGLIGMASACVNAEWFGKTSPFPSRTFALTYREAQTHDFFVLDSPCRRLSNAHYTACWIDLRTGDDNSQGQIALLLVRPFARGGILRLRDELRPRQLHELLVYLRTERSRESRLLLPQLQLHSQADMISKWKTSGVEVTALRSGPRSTRPISPPFVSASHGATLRIDEMGVGCTLNEDEKTHTRVPHSYSPLRGSIDHSINPNFHFRADSPFLLFLVHIPTLAPIIAGCYAGAPATSSLMLRRTMTNSQSSVRVSKNGKDKKKSKVSRIVKSITDKIGRLKKRTKEKLKERKKKLKNKKKSQKSKIDGETTRSTTTSEESSDSKWREKLRSMRSDDNSKSVSRKKSTRKKVPAPKARHYTKPPSSPRQFFA
ncbi:hypothetical protein PRIPAC_92272, partial [Pristionchus pacificus]|uniref:SERPIN domain-containing protein n=1 Tax=Pristionchus pacificus TaxID=54126 RepID=A0A2A6BBD2_PRIPA